MPCPTFRPVLLLWTFFLILCKVYADESVVETTRVLEDLGGSSLSSSFDLLCERLDRMTDFLCECVPQIPFRSIECQSTEICSVWCPGTCGRFLFQVDYLGPDISQLQSCVTYTQQPSFNNDNDAYRDGCISLRYEGEDTPSSCQLSFVGGGTGEEQQQQLQDCESCSLCGDGTSLQASCNGVQPLATTMGCTAVHLDAFFPGFRADDCAVTSSAPRVIMLLSVVEVIVSVGYLL